MSASGKKSCLKHHAARNSRIQARPGSSGADTDMMNRQHNMIPGIVDTYIDASNVGVLPAPDIGIGQVWGTDCGEKQAKIGIFGGGFTSGSA